MRECEVLLVAGTHGNEVNAPWLFDQWQKDPGLINCHGLKLHSVIGNPVAREANRRYIDRDLNRSFQPELLVDQSLADLELNRAKELLDLHGPEGLRPCHVAIDLHSTTSAMGNCLVLYGRRPADLALAALVQGALGLPIYLHEADSAQTGFLVEQWPCGLVIEVGPVPQSVLQGRIVRQTRLALEACLVALANVRRRQGRYPRQLVVHRHLGSRDVPRDDSAQPQAFIHSCLQQQDWNILSIEDPLFETVSGAAHPERLDEGAAVVFVNEAAYAEKGIAFSLCCREVWPMQGTWIRALETLMVEDVQRGGPL
ncbi:MAG: aspartoacylase [Cyanobium sp. NAT70]|nr:aspartoacylase [Cyanobium sp. NAT70]